MGIGEIRMQNGEWRVESGRSAKKVSLSLKTGGLRSSSGTSWTARCNSRGHAVQSVSNALLPTSMISRPDQVDPVRTFLGAIGDWFIKLRCSTSPSNPCSQRSVPPRNLFLLLIPLDFFHYHSSHLFVIRSHSSTCTHLADINLISTWSVISHQ